MIRFFDFFLSLIGLVLTSPIFLFLSIWIKFDSKGSVFYSQKRIGKGGIIFSLIKFRSMFNDAENKGLITVGNRDPRITNSGYYIRKFKFDELPQLINVLKGEMSMVGPRPEVKRYVDLYTNEQRKVLEIKPGITDYASILFSNENELLAKVDDPDSYYINVIMPKKIEINMIYIQNKSLFQYFKIIFKTIFKIIY